ncbi:hypothetical protein QUF58_00765 [Anaerolineales bacterium HSG24]|nr:hypothetical protein [Anaerolineales bacterium HSG24]
MIKRGQWWLLIILLWSIMTGGILAQDSEPLLQRSLWSATSGLVADTDNQFLLSGSLGEPIVGRAMVTGSYHLQTGYWSEGVRHETMFYLPLVVRK